jgi:hypothetical protein
MNDKDLKKSGENREIKTDEKWTESQWRGVY